MMDANNGRLTQQREIEALLAERDALKDRVEELEERYHDLEETHSQACIAHEDRVTELLGVIAEKSEALIRIHLAHNLRTKELLEANNREVGRRRDAERIVTGLLDITTTSGEWLKDNASAVGALIEGRAAVVPLKVDLWQEDWGRRVSAIRLDKPVGDK